MIKIRKSEMHIASLQKTLIQDNGIKKNKHPKKDAFPFSGKLFIFCGVH